VAGRRRLLVAAAIGCLVVLAGACAFNRRVDGPHGDPDPGGRILAALRPVRGAVPQDAVGVERQDVEPMWDSCDGRTGTFGWSDVHVIITFSTAMEPQVLVSTANTRMVTLGWIPGPALDSPIGPGGRWTRALGDGTEARAALSPWMPGGGQPLRWELTAYAPAHGPRTSGC
jgi:hypothetical protein